MHDSALVGAAKASPRLHQAIAIVRRLRAARAPWFRAAPECRRTDAGDGRYFLRRTLAPRQRRRDPADGLVDVVAGCGAAAAACARTGRPGCAAPLSLESRSARCAGQRGCPRVVESLGPAFAGTPRVPRGSSALVPLA